MFCCKVVECKAIVVRGDAMACEISAKDDRLWKILLGSLYCYLLEGNRCRQEIRQVGNGGGDKHITSYSA